MKRNFKKILPFFAILLSSRLILAEIQNPQPQQQENNRIVKSYDQYLDTSKQGDSANNVEGGLVHYKGSSETLDSKLDNILGDLIEQAKLTPQSPVGVGSILFQDSEYVAPFSIFIREEINNKLSNNNRVKILTKSEAVDLNNKGTIDKLNIFRGRYNINFLKQEITLFLELCRLDTGNIYKQISIIPFHLFSFNNINELLFPEIPKTSYIKSSDSRPRHALLIANSNYSNFGGGLANAIPDAVKLHEVLDAIGFEITLIKNADHEGMEVAIDDFKERIRGTHSITLFHYGGHGVQVDGKNYLIPADADIPDERLVKHRAVDLDEVIGALETADPSASVIVIDACRNNPLPAVATRSATRGLAVVGRKPKNSVIIFAAEPGGEANDGLFTPILADTIAQNPNLSVGQIMLKVRAKVINQSNGSQTPGEYSQLVEEVFLKANPDTKK